MPADQILISIIMPVYNRAKSARRAINSLAIFGNSSCELIIVDDGSSDGSAEAAREATAGMDPALVRVLEQKNAGPGAARNTGANVARGTYLAFIDSDDLWYPWTVEAIASVIENHSPALAFLRTVDYEAGRTPPTLEHAKIETNLFPGFLEAVISEPSIRFGSGNLVVRRALFSEIGGFTVEVRCAEDTDLFMRLADRGVCVLATAPVLVAIETDRGDNLTGGTDRVIDGVNYVISRDASGAYLGDRRKRNVLISKLVVTAVKTAFAEGKAKAAYGFMIRRFHLIWRGRNWHWIIRLPIFPLLAALKPQSFIYKSRKG